MPLSSTLFARLLRARQCAPEGTSGRRRRRVWSAGPRRRDDDTSGASSTPAWWNGRHRGLKIPSRKACRFESGRGHHIEATARSKVAIWMVAREEREALTHPAHTSPFAFRSFVGCPGQLQSTRLRPRGNARVRPSVQHAARSAHGGECQWVRTMAKQSGEDTTGRGNQISVLCYVWGLTPNRGRSR